MNYTRPQGVSASAVPIPPVQLSPIQVLISEFQTSGQPLPAFLTNISQQANVQQATIQSVLVQNAHANIEAYKRDQQAASDWSINQGLYGAVGIPSPPKPVPTPKIVETITYAKPDGTIVIGPGAENGSNVAWLDQEYRA